MTNVIAVGPWVVVEWHADGPRTEGLSLLVGGEVERTVGRVGGGALPPTELESYECDAAVAAARG